MTDIWTLLEQDAPNGCESVQDLYSWSLNYDAGRGPFTLLLDLIGYSDEEYGTRLYDMDRMSLGYMELSKLGKALDAFANDPHGVMDYIRALLAAESSDEEDTPDTASSASRQHYIDTGAYLTTGEEL